MKIYFYDGNLDDYFHKPKSVDLPLFTIVDAKDGVAVNYEKLKSLNKESYPFIVMTNSIIALSHIFGWDSTEKHTNIFIWKDQYNSFVRCDKLTMKEIREGHNIAKMYIAGSFDDKIIEDCPYYWENLNAFDVPDDDDDN